LRILVIAAKGAFIICLPVLLLTATIGWAANSLWLYESGFEKYDVSQTTGLNEVELGKVATGLISYFNSGADYINLGVTKDGESFELFTQEEKTHFRDVKGLFQLDYWVLLGTFIYCVAYTGGSLFWWKGRTWRRLVWGVVGGSGFTLVLMLALGIWVWLGFDRLFLQFHLISFTNAFWSAEGYMLLLFPHGFWYDTVLLCVGIIVGLAVILGGAAGGYLLFTRRRSKS
jgi:integral membrane protein (TIGR01906 family)